MTMADDSLGGQSPRPIKTSTPANAKVPRAVLDSDLSSAGEDFVSPMPFPRNMAPGATPYNHGKPSSSFYSISFSTPPASTTTKSTNGNAMKDLEKVLEQQRKESCLFGTVNVKGLAAVIIMLEIFFVGSLTNSDVNSYAADVSFNTFFYVILFLLAVLTLALGGVHCNKAWMLMPLVVIHAVFVFLAAFAIGTIVGTHIVLMQLPRPSTVLTLINYTTAGLAFLYQTMVLYWCCRVLKKGGPVLPMLSVINENYEPYGSETLQSMVDKEDDVVLFDSVKSKPRKLAASPGPLSGRRQVRFLDV